MSKVAEWFKRKSSQRFRNRIAPIYRRALAIAPYAFRFSSKNHSLPSFLIIGAQKCGTTTLYDCIEQHPGVGKSWRKEVSFFDQNWDRGVGWYKAHFRSTRNSQLIFGEATPDYLLNRDSPHRILETFNPTLLITLLRNPVDRAISHYFHEKRLGREKRNIEDVFDFQNGRLNCQVVSPPFGFERKRHYFSYLERGMYFSQLSYWFSVIPQKKFLIVKSEEFFGSPQKILLEIFGKLSLDPHEVPNLLPKNVGTYDDKVNPKLVTELREFYRDENRKLLDLTGVGWD